MTGSVADPALLLPLPRPEYPGGPEAFLTAVAWSALDRGSINLPSGQKALGLAYIDDGGRRPGTISLKQTFPDAQAMPGWNDALLEAELSADGTQPGPAIAHALRGVQPEKGFTIPASPLTRHTSLLQNPVGLTRKPHPFNVATMLESIYSLGATSADDSSTVAGRWLEATRVRTELNPLLRAVDRAVLNDRLGFLGGIPEWQSPRRELHGWGDALSGATPFGWFHRSWNTLTDQDWVEALPPRVWIDWATAVMRMALGFSYLWEAQWYERLARLTLGGELGPNTEVGGLVASIHEVLPWRPSSESTSIRDVVLPMKARIGRGVAVRDVLKGHITAVDEPGALNQLWSLAGEEHFRGELQAALATTSTKNVWEAVRYALAARSESGAQADFYGILRNAGTRYAVVEPGTEWTALMAALAAGRPNNRCTVGDVRNQLASLGLYPDLSELIGLLEVAGLARGSADADQAVEVQSPY